MALGSVISLYLFCNTSGKRYNRGVLRECKPTAQEALH